MKIHIRKQFRLYLILAILLMLMATPILGSARSLEQGPWWETVP
jgi:hypothetical protein